MASVDSGIFIVKTVNFSIPKAHNLLGSMFAPIKLKELWKNVDILIIGAGLSGIASAARLVGNIDPWFLWKPDPGLGAGFYARKTGLDSIVGHFS